jgi:4-alpha-glucanotransferase
MPCSVDELMDYTSLSSDIRMLVDVRKRRPMWKI